MNRTNKIGLLMKSLSLAACLLVVSLPALAVTPEAAWKADLADTNKDYTVVPHAILKIRDGPGGNYFVISHYFRPFTTISEVIILKQPRQVSVGTFREYSH